MVTSLEPSAAMSATVQPTAIRVERHDTVVIGAGQAGLAAGYHLSQRGADFVILEAAARLGDTWRKRWDSLHVLTSAAFTGLPGLPFPTADSHLPRKDELADYLEGYAAHFALPVRLNTRVESLRRECDRYLIDAGEVTYIARHVIVATGPFQVPRIPAFARELHADIQQLHSSAYRNPSDLPPGNVLVVGMGNAGVRIALEVSKHRPVTLAGPRTRHLWRTLLGRDIHWWLWPVVRRLTTATRLGRLLRRRLAHDPLVGVSEGDLVAAHVERRGRVSAVRNGRPVADGESLDVRTIIWCTGFAPDFSWIRIPLPMEGGAPRTDRGVVPGVPGLSFVGLPFQHTLASALIAGVGEDAGYVVGRIKAPRAVRAGVVAQSEADPDVACGGGERVLGVSVGVG
jgi:putative flavoprotein involved in K+ transport